MPELILAFFQALSSLIIASVAVMVFRYNRRKDESAKRMQLFQIIEQNFDVLQRLNETALRSGRHARAAMKSVNPDEDFPEEKAMIVFFHYHRLNRMFRLYEYWKNDFIDEPMFLRTFDAYKGTLLEALPLMDDLAPRGYPEDFITYLKDHVSETDRAPFLDQNAIQNALT